MARPPTYLSTYLALADHSERVLSESLRAVADGHAAVADVHHVCLTLAGLSDEHRRRLAPLADRYGDRAGVEEHVRLRVEAMPGTRTGEVGLLRDLQDLHLLATFVETSWTVVGQGAQALRDAQLLEVATSCSAETSRQLTWLITRIKVTAPQALVSAP
jgi:hypothetical protein